MSFKYLLIILNMLFLVLLPQLSPAEKKVSKKYQCTQDNDQGVPELTPEFIAKSEFIINQVHCRQNRKQCWEEKQQTYFSQEIWEMNKAELQEKLSTFIISNDIAEAGSGVRIDTLEESINSRGNRDLEKKHLASAFFIGGVNYYRNRLILRPGMHFRSRIVNDAVSKLNMPRLIEDFKIGSKQRYDILKNQFFSSGVDQLPDSKTYKAKDLSKKLTAIAKPGLNAAKKGLKLVNIVPNPGKAVEAFIVAGGLALLAQPVDYMEVRECEPIKYKKSKSTFVGGADITGQSVLFKYGQPFKNGKPVPGEKCEKPLVDFLDGTVLFYEMNEELQAQQLKRHPDLCLQLSLMYQDNKEKSELDLEVLSCQADKIKVKVGKPFSYFSGPEMEFLGHYDHKNMKLNKTDKIFFPQGGKVGKAHLNWISYESKLENNYADTPRLCLSDTPKPCTQSLSGFSKEYTYYDRNYCLSQKSCFNFNSISQENISKFELGESLYPGSWVSTAIKKYTSDVILKPMRTVNSLEAIRAYRLESYLTPLRYEIEKCCNKILLPGQNPDALEAYCSKYGELFRQRKKSSELRPRLNLKKNGTR